MLTVQTVAELRALSGRWRASAQRIALVPTMGNLHAGHLSLVAAARQYADRVVASIFVNPTQFGPGEDFSRYPRTPQADAQALSEAGCDALFTPSVEEVYPAGATPPMVAFDAGELGRQLCGAFRPGHFAGVLQVVARLFNHALPDVALFGEKDYQQLVLLQALARDLAFPIEVRGLPTVREVDGLAMSSRNQYLAETDRRRAAGLHASLQDGAKSLRAGQSIAEVEQSGYQALQSMGFRPDYFSIRRSRDLAFPAADDRQLRILAAARLGDTRLIDNIAVELPDPGSRTVSPA